MTTLTYSRRLAFAVVVIGMLLFTAAPSADASHFRSAIIQPTVDGPGVLSGGNVAFTVTWKITHSWRRSAFGSPNVGDEVDTGQSFDFGDGETTALIGEVTSIDSVEDWIVLNSEFSETYVFPDSNIDTFAPFFESCCRISTLQEGNADSSFRVQGRLVLDGRRASLPPPQNVPNQAPSVSNLPVISVIDAGNPTSSFLIVASDPEGGPLNFSFAPETDPVLPHSLLPHPVPSGLTINSSTGLATWDLTQLGAARAAGNLFATQVIVKDNKNNRTPTDFLMKLVTGAGVPPTLRLNGVAADLTLDAVTNSAVSFPVAASDPDPGSLVTLTVAGLPAGATLTPSLPFTATAPSTTFHWTPTTPGTTTMTFAATDNVGFVTQRTATIRVTVPNHRPTITCPGPTTLLPSVAQTLTVRVADADEDPLAVTWSINGVLQETDNVAGSATPINVSFTHTYATGNYTVTASATDGVALPAACSIAVTVAPPAAVLKFSAATYTVSEGSAFATILVLRTGSSTSQVTVDFATAAATSGVPATAGSDYTPVSGTLTFHAGETSLTFKVPIINDTAVEGSEHVKLVLRHPSAGATLGTPSIADLVIQDNDSQSVIEFTGRYQGNKPEVRRTGNLAQRATVHFQSTGGTATAGSDFVALNANLTFNPGVSLQYIPLTILSDNVAEGTESFVITLSNPQPSASVRLGAGSTLLVNISDDDFGGTVQFEFPTYTAAEGTAKTIKIVRTGGAGIVMTVGWSRISGTATPGTDFTPSSGTVTFGPSETFKTITVNLRSDGLAETAETIRLGLTVPPNGAGRLGTNATTLLTISPSP